MRSQNTETTLLGALRVLGGNSCLRAFTLNRVPQTGPPTRAKVFWFFFSKKNCLLSFRRRCRRRNERFLLGHLRIRRMARKSPAGRGSRRTGVPDSRVDGVLLLLANEKAVLASRMSASTRSGSDDSGGLIDVTKDEDVSGRLRDSRDQSFLLLFKKEGLAFLQATSRNPRRRPCAGRSSGSSGVVPLSRIASSTSGSGSARRR